MKWNNRPYNLIKVYLVGYLTLLFSLSITNIQAAPKQSSIQEPFRLQRQQLIDTIKETVRETSFYLDKEELNPKVLEALNTVPRHLFVTPDSLSNAYKNRPLPIGYGQTISQPYIVAIMSDLIKPKATHKVLEIGTGSGYQAAILAQLVEKVYSIEIIEPLAKQAAKRFKDLHYTNIYSKVADGYYGWSEHAPYDAIVVTAAASHVPNPLIKQLKPGGHMIIPVGSRFLVQQLLLISKTETGQVLSKQILPVRFVPLTGKH